MKASKWAFIGLMWYICILCVQPQNRFTFLYPLHIADVCVVSTLILHAIASAQEGRPLLRLGPATILALLLMFFSFVSLHVGPFQTSHAWNPNIEIIFKNCIVLILIEAMAINVNRVWGVQATLLIATLWWVKGGLRLSAAGATYSGDRIMGAAVSLIENPNGFAYLMGVMLPMYLFFYQSEQNKWLRYFFLGLFFASIYIIWQTGSRTGMMALFALMFFLVPKYFKRNKMLLVSGGVILYLVFSIVSPGNVARFKTIPDSAMHFLMGNRGSEKDTSEMTMDEQSAWERRIKNQHTWELVKQNLAFGVGVNADDWKIPDELWAARGQVHNEFLFAGRQMGLIGMGLYAGLIATLISRGWLVRKMCQSWWSNAADLGWTFLLQGIVFVTAGFFSPIPWNPVFLILTGSASALMTNLREGRYLVAAPAAAPLAGPPARAPALSNA